jgi:hypothetical protein
MMSPAQMMDEIYKELESKIMNIRYVEEVNLIRIEFLLKNLNGYELSAFDLTENHVVRFECIRKGRLVVTIDLDLEEV